MSESVYLITIFLLPVTAVLIFGMRFLARIKEAKLRYASEESYRQLAERSIAAHADAAAALEDLQRRTVAVEKILKEVE